MKRYERQIGLPEIGISGQQKLTDAKVLIIGAGGLGCPVLQNLAAAGVGCIGLADGDFIEESNLHRQLLYTPNDIGKPKVTVAAAVASKQNPTVNVVTFPTHFTEQNCFELVADYQIIVDCTDDIATRYLINDVALAKGIPIVYASIHKLEGQLSVFNYKNGPTYRCLFPEKGNIEAFTNCNDSGVLGVLPNTLGALQATEVLKIILEIGTVLSGKLVLYHALRSQFETISFQKNPKEITIGLLRGQAVLTNENTTTVQIVTAATFFEEVQNLNTLVIDIRESYEEPKLALPNIKSVPLAALDNFLAGIDNKQQIILCCQQGKNSALAANYLTQKGFSQVSHLENGINALPKDKINSAIIL